MVDIVLRIPQGKTAAVKTWLESKGIEYGKDEDGVTLTKGHRILGVVNSRIRKAANGDKYCSIRFEDKIAAKLPIKPNYIIWRSDILVDRMVDQFHYIYHEPVYNEEGELVTGGSREKVIDEPMMMNTTEEWPTFQVEDSENPGEFISQTVGGLA